MQQPPAPQAHTLDTLKNALVTHRPELEPVINPIFTKLADPATPTGEIVEQLQAMLRRDVTPEESDTNRTFTWRNPSNQPIVLTIPRENTREANAPAARATEEPECETAAEAAPEAPAASEPQNTSEPQESTTERERINLLDEIDTLLDKTNVHLLIQRTGTTKDGQNVLSVTVVPQAKDDKTDPSLLIPVNLKGTACELEEGLVKAIRITDEGNRSIEDSLAELEAAKKEAAAAKKAEASKAKKAATRSTAKAAAAKKEEEQPATPTLFDAPNPKTQGATTEQAPQ